MDTPYSKLHNLTENALRSNITPHKHIENVVQIFRNEKVVPILNEYFSKSNCANSKLLLASSVSFLNLKKCRCDCVDIEKLAKNISRLIRAWHRSVILILDSLKKLLKDSRISCKTRLECLFEILTRTTKSPYPINKQIEDLCKTTIKLLTPDIRMVHISQCIALIETSALSDVNCVFLSELLKHAPLDAFYASIPVLLHYIGHGFCTNITAVQRSYLYKVLVERLDFAEWQNRVFHPFVNLFNRFHSNECFMESIKSYFIPLSALKYKEEFYVACRCNSNNVALCAATLGYLARRGLCDPCDYRRDVVVFSQLDENVGFELLCRSRQVLAIMNFLFDYRWLDDTERVICSLNRADCDGYWEGLFDFSVVLLCSSSRVHAEFGRELLKVVREKMQIDGAYWKFLLEVYMKNSAIGAGFVYDLTGFVDCQNLWAVVERYKHSRNISCLTKASCAQHIYLKAHVDANSFISNVIKKLDKIDKSSFQDGSTLFYIKTLKLLCEENHNEKIFYTLSNTINTLLSNTNHPTHERKLYESSLSDVLTTMHSLLPHNKTNPLAIHLLNSCFLTIQQSNFKQPVTTASAILQKAASFTTPEVLSTLIDTCFNCLDSHTTNTSTIRCSAEYRLVLENICLADASGVLVKNVFQRLLGLLKDDAATEFAAEAALHAIDALLSNKLLQTSTRCYVEEVVEIVLEGDWMRCFRTRNAVIQVWRTVINTFKGAPLEKTFLEYNRLAPVFYETLAKGANEKSLLILSVFIECPQGMYLLKPNLNKGVLDCFMTLFVDLIFNDRGYCGRFAADAYVAQCRPDDIILILDDVTSCLFLRGFVANFVVLVRGLVEKYLFYFGNFDAIRDVLCAFLKGISRYQIDFKAVINGDGDLPMGLHINFLESVLEKAEKNPCLIFDMLNDLIVTAINLNTSQHLIQIYAQTIFFLYEKQENSKLFRISKHIDFSENYNLHHFSILSLVFSHGSDVTASVEKILLHQLFRKYRDISQIQDPEILTFFATTLPYVFKCAKTPKQKLTIFKLAVHFMVSGDADSEFCKFIATINNTKLTNLMCSVKRFFSYETLVFHLQSEVFEFLVDTSAYVTQLKIDNEASFYSIDTESHSLALPVVKLLLFKCFEGFYANKCMKHRILNKNDSDDI